MDEKNQIKSLLKEAEVYRTQGLLDQSKDKYETLLRLIEESEELSGDGHLIHSVKEGLQRVETVLEEVENSSDTPMLTEEKQNLIHHLFSFSKNREIAAMEGAVALAKFGQYEKALAHFQAIINEGILTMTAAKNMLMCHLTLNSSDAAVSQYGRWVKEGNFSAQELLYLKDFLVSILNREGVISNLPGPGEGDQKNGRKERAEDIFEIYSIRARLDKGHFKGETVDFDVTYQLGNTVSIIIRAHEKELLNHFHPGVRLSEVQYYSPRSLFNASGVVSEKKEIKRGPKRGDYSFDLTIEEPKSVRQSFEVPFPEFEACAEGFQIAKSEGYHGA